MYTITQSRTINGADKQVFEFYVQYIAWSAFVERCNQLGYEYQSTGTPGEYEAGGRGCELTLIYKSH